MLRVGLAQINTVVGDLDGNVEAIALATASLAARGCSLVVVPELAICGYPPEDLVLKPGFVAANLDALASLTARIDPATTLVSGFVERSNGRLHNSAAVIARNEIVGTYRKRRLPNYSVFDEQRYFEPGSGDAPIFHVDGVAVGVSICEDAWMAGGPLAELVRGGAQVVVNINASPFYRGRIAERRAMLTERAVETGVPIIYVNLVGGQDELVFDGGSMVVDAAGAVVASAPQFAECLMATDVGSATGMVNVERDGAPVDAAVVADLDPPEEVYRALVVGTGDYVAKNGFTDVVIGLSGGVDSALVAAVAADALGPDHVHTVAMPSRYSSQGSLDDAADLATRVGVAHRVLPIEDAHRALLSTLEPHFGGGPPGIAEENLQARIRGTIVMALSNKHGWLPLSTGNKSEMAVGYSTLYGDMNGGFNPIKDVPKLFVYELCRWRNGQSGLRAGVEPIPESILAKAPSAELRPDQRDEDSLPPYDVLDPLLEAYVEGDGSVADLIALGFEEDLVHRVVAMVDRAEYKRRQAPPGVRITAKAFGKDRRLPITNGFRG
ncbi:MAG TPA: NAD+ synthase [Acidimicrobiales bacterium]